MRALLTFLVLVATYSVAFTQCKPIVAEAKVTHSTSGLNNGVIQLDIKSNKSDLSISFFGPKGLVKIKLDKTEIDGLAKGKYLVVLSGKRESDNYCPKSLEIIIN